MRIRCHGRWQYARTHWRLGEEILLRLQLVFLVVIHTAILTNSVSLHWLLRDFTFYCYVSWQLILLFATLKSIHTSFITIIYIINSVQLSSFSALLSVNRVLEDCLDIEHSLSTKHHVLCAVCFGILHDISTETLRLCLGIFMVCYGLN